MSQYVSILRTYLARHCLILNSKGIRKGIKVYIAPVTLITCCNSTFRKCKHLERSVALISNKLYSQGVLTHIWQEGDKMEGCGVPPKRAGNTSERCAIILVTEYHILDSLYGKGKQRWWQNQWANFTSSHQWFLAWPKRINLVIWKQLTDI